MKFDKIIGNPPYDKNLHLKILEKIVPMLNDNGEIVWIHPARWAQDLLAPYKKNSDYNKYKDLPFHSNNIEIISRDIANKAFNTNSDSNLMISYLNKSGTGFATPIGDSVIQDILRKVMLKNKQSINNFIEKDKIDGIRVCIKSIVPISGSGGRNFQYKFSAFRLHDNYYAVDGYSDGVYWTDKLVKNQFSRKIGEPFPLSIKFNSNVEAQNFIDCCNLEIYKFICIISKAGMSVPLNYLPYMVDYKRVWTNDDLIKYFDFTKEEVNYIYKTLEQYS